MLVGRVEGREHGQQQQQHREGAPGGPVGHVERVHAQRREHPEGEGAHEGGPEKARAGLREGPGPEAVQRARVAEERVEPEEEAVGGQQHAGHPHEQAHAGLGEAGAGGGRPTGPPR